MNITTTHKDGRLVLTGADASLTDETREALGRDRCSWSCNEDKAKLWPFTFDLTLRGSFESKKEGRLAATIHLSGTWRKGAKGPDFGEQVRVTLFREALGEKLGGWHQHDLVSSLVREKMAQGDTIKAAAREAIIKALGEVFTRETEKAQAHLDRAAAAKGAALNFKK